MRVNFFLIGAQKAGTSTLHDYLRTYLSGVYMTPKKETFYFTQARFWKDLAANDFSSYHDSNFQDVPKNSLYIGESSTHYSMLPLAPGVAPKIKLYNDQAKILYVVRNPVDRAVSNYWHFVSLSAEGMPMLEAFKKNRQYEKTGDYMYQIMPYLDSFPLENIRILLFDDLVNKPVESLKRISLWLKGTLFDESSFPQGFVPVERRSKNDLKELSIASGSILSKFKYSNLWRYRLRKFVPPLLREAGKKFALKPIKPGEGDALHDELSARKYLQPILAPLWSDFLDHDTIKRLVIRVK
jgi:hypothetical protein